MARSEEKTKLQFSVKNLLIAQAIAGSIAAIVGGKWLWAFIFVVAPLFVIYVLSALALLVVVGAESVVNAVRVHLIDQKKPD